MQEELVREELVREELVQEELPGRSEQARCRGWCPGQCSAGGPRHRDWPGMRKTLCPLT